jgi:hypothetical protein
LEVARNAAAIIFDREAEEPADEGIGTPPGVGFGYDLETGADGNHTAIRHGVTCVQRQIDENLFHTAFTEAPRGELFSELQPELVTLAQGQLQHFLHALDGF